MGKMIDFLFKHRDKSLYAYVVKQKDETEALSEASENSNYIGYINTFLGVIFLFKEEIRSNFFIPLRDDNYVSSDEIIALMMISEVAI